MANVNYITYTPSTDDELKKSAELQFGDMYDSLLTQAQRKADGLAGQKKAQISTLDGLYDDRATQVGETFDQQRRQVEQAALDRGFGRSSYVVDRIGRSFELQTQSLESLQKEKLLKISDLEQQIEGLYETLFDDKQRLTTEKANKILYTIDSMRREQEQAAIDVQKYNNDLLLRQEAAEAARLQEQRDYQLSLDRLAYDREKALRDYEAAQQQRIIDQNYRNAQLQMQYMQLIQKNTPVTSYYSTPAPAPQPQPQPQPYVNQNTSQNNSLTNNGGIITSGATILR